MRTLPFPCANCSANQHSRGANRDPASAFRIATGNSQIPIELPSAGTWMLSETIFVSDPAGNGRLLYASIFYLIACCDACAVALVTFSPRPIAGHDLMNLADVGLKDTLSDRMLTSIIRRVGIPLHPLVDQARDFGRTKHPARGFRAIEHGKYHWLPSITMPPPSHVAAACAGPAISFKPSAAMHSGSLKMAA